jgi:HK97 family phage major capsid protein
MDEMNELNEITHHYRKTLEAFAKRTGIKTEQVENRGSGEEREKVAKMDEDMSAIERIMQLRKMGANAEPQFAVTARAASDDGSWLYEGMSRRDREKYGKRDYTERFMQAIVAGDMSAFRALSTGTSNAPIPTDLERRIVEKRQQASIARQIAVVNTIDSTREITVEGSLPTTAKVAEGGSITPNDLSFDPKITVIKTKYVTAGKASREYLQDVIGTSGIGSGLDYLARKHGISMGLFHEEQFTIGDGSGDPEGFAGSSMQTKLAAISQVTDLGGAAITTVTGDNLIDTYHLVKPQYRVGPRFSWVFSDTFLKTVRKIKTGTGSNDYVWKPSETGGISDGVPGTVYGVPYRISAYVPTGTVNNNIFAVIGNFEYFEIFDRQGIEVLIDPYSAAATDETLVYMFTRTDSRVMLPAAFAAITC